MRYLLDVNVLLALTDEDHAHYGRVTQWFDAEGIRDWGVCPLTEAAFLRIASNPQVGQKTVEEAMELLTLLAQRPGYRFWPISTGWATLVTPFRKRVFGHQQITDAFLLGLAVREGGVLVTMDRAILYLAGEKHRGNVLLLE